MNAPERIRVTCPHCQRRLRVRGDMVGKQIRCPNTSCGSSLNVLPDPPLLEELEELEELDPLPSTGRLPRWVWIAVPVGVAGLLAVLGLVLMLNMGKGGLAESTQVSERKMDTGAKKDKADARPADTRPADTSPEPKRDKQADDGNKKGPPDEKKQEEPKPSQPLWPRAVVAKLEFVVSAKTDTQAKLDESKFPKIPFNKQKVADHLAKAQTLVVNEKLSSARRMIEARFWIAGRDKLRVTMNLYIESEDTWPTGQVPFSMRIHGVRLPVEPFGQLGKIPFMLALAQMNQITEDVYDLVLVGEKVDAEGKIEGKLMGKMIGGGTITDIPFELKPDEFKP